MAEYSTLIPTLTSYAPGAPPSFILERVAAVVRDFCKRSTSYRKTFYLDALEGVASYLVPLPEKTRAEKIISATYTDENGREIRLNPTSSRIDAAKEYSSTSVIRLMDGGSIFLDTPPTAPGGGAIKVELALRPQQSAREVDDEFFEDNYDAIVNGTVFRLLTIPNSDWENLRAASVYNSQYEMAIVEARLKADGENTSKIRTTTYGGIP